MIDLPHVASRVFGTPLMIARAKLEVILSVIAPRLVGTPLDAVNPISDPAPQTSITVEKIAVVSVIGTLVARSSYIDAASGLLSYGEIGDAIATSMDDPSVRGVILDVDSPGGEVGGLFDLVDQIGAIKRGTDKPLWAVANESALSAAYAIASTADRLYVTQTGEVGSIGVVAVHVDESGADTKAGLAWTFVFAGDSKVDGNAHEPLSARARATIQVDVDNLYMRLCGLVAANRTLPIAAVRGTNADVYRGELAIRAGLADRLGTLDLAIADMAAEFDQPRAESPARIIINNPTPKRSTSMATNETERIEHDAGEPQRPLVSEAAPQTPQSEPAAPPIQISAPIKVPPSIQEPVPIQAPATEPAATPTVDPGAMDKLRAEFAEIAALTAQAARLGVTIDAADAMRRGVSANELRRSVLDALAARAEATNIIAAAPSQPVVGDSPIVRRAKQSAAAARH